MFAIIGWIYATTRTQVATFEEGSEGGSGDQVGGVFQEIERQQIKLYRTAEPGWHVGMVKPHGVWRDGLRQGFS